MKLLLKIMKFRWLSLKNDFTQTKFFLVLLVLFTASAGCISSATNLAEDNHGTLNINGSAVMSPMMTKEAAAFNAAYPAANVISGSSSSGAGIKDLSNGSIDIATTSQLQKKSEYAMRNQKEKLCILQSSLMML